MAESIYSKTYTSFSGADIVATFAGRVIGELQGITYSITREKAPIYTLGSPDPRSFSRGKRGIAGNLIFSVFDRDALVEELKGHADMNITGWSSVAASHGYMGDMQTWDDYMSGQITSLEPSHEGIVSDLLDFASQPQAIEYVDEIPPFDVTITFANEYGQVASMAILGVEILNEGSGMSIDDVVTERAMTYVARRLQHIRPGLPNVQPVRGGTSNTSGGGAGSGTEATT
jgi:hypothetical protein